MSQDRCEVTGMEQRIRGSRLKQLFHLLWKRICTSPAIGQTHPRAQLASTSTSTRTQESPPLPKSLKQLFRLQNSYLVLGLEFGETVQNLPFPQAQITPLCSMTRLQTLLPQFQCQLKQRGGDGTVLAQRAGPPPHR